MSDADIRSAIRDEFAADEHRKKIAEAERLSAASAREIAELEAAKRKLEDAEKPDWGAMSPNDFHDELGRRCW